MAATDLAAIALPKSDRPIMFPDSRKPQMDVR